MKGGCYLALFSVVLIHWTSAIPLPDENQDGSDIEGKSSHRRKGLFVIPVVSQLPRRTIDECPCRKCECVPVSTPKPCHRCDHQSCSCQITSNPCPCEPVTTAKPCHRCHHVGKKYLSERSVAGVGEFSDSMSLLASNISDVNTTEIATDDALISALSLNETEIQPLTPSELADPLKFSEHYALEEKRHSIKVPVVVKVSKKDNCKHCHHNGGSPTPKPQPCKKCHASKFTPCKPNNCSGRIGQRSDSQQSILQSCVGSRCCPAENGRFPVYLPDPVLKKVFYECDWGLAYPFICPDDTVFNPKLNVCDYEQ